MAYEINDLKRILTLVLFAIPMIASRNINCSGRAFHCVNSTHFMICVDLGGGLSTTIDDFVIPCPATTVCHINNVFECDFPEVQVTTPPLQVIDIYKQSDTSETSLVTTSVTASTATSEILSVFKENITATTLQIPEDVTPVFILEVLEDVKNPIRGNSDNTTETNIQVNPSFIDTPNEIVNDKQSSNKTITTSATDNNKNLESAVEPSIHKAVNASLTDKTKSIDTVTSVIGLINLISIDHPTVVNSKPSSDVLTSLDTLYDNIATTTEQYTTKQVIIQGAKKVNVNETIHNQTIPTDTFSERSVNTDEVSPTPVINIFINKDINNSIKDINTTDSDNQTIVERDYLDKSNSTTEVVPETTKEYFAPAKIRNVSEPVTEVAGPQTTTDKTIVPLKVVDLIPVGFYEEKAPSTKSSPDYLNKLKDNTVSTINQKITLSDISVTTEALSTTPILKPNNQNINKSDTDNDFFTEFNLTVDITTTENVPEMNTTYFNPEPVTVASLQTNTEKTLITISKETNIIYTRETTPTSGNLFENYSLVEKHMTATQPLEIIMTTDSSIKNTDDFYELDRELNQTLISTKNKTADTMNTNESLKTVYKASTKDIINDKSTDPTLLPPTTIQHPVKTATTEAIQNKFTAHATEVLNNLPEMKDLSFNEPSTTNVKNDTRLNHRTNLTAKTTDNVNTVFTALRTDIVKNKGTEPTLFPPTTIKYPANEILPTETKENEFTVRLAEAISEFPATDIPISVYEPHTDNNKTNTLLHVQSTPYNVTSDAVRNTTIKDLTSQSDIVTNAQIHFTPDTIAPTASDGYTSIDQVTIPKATINPETKIPGNLNRPENLEPDSLQENLNADQWTTTIADQNLVSMSTTDSNYFQNSATTPFSDDVTENNSKADITAAINKVTSQDVLPKTNYYVIELTSTTPNTAETTSISTDTKILQQVTTPELVSIYSVSTTDDKTETSTTFTVDVANTTNIVNVRDLPITILPTQELAMQKNVTVNQLNTTSTTTETIRDLLPSNVTTTGYAILYTEDIDLKTKHLVNSEPIIYEVDANADVNKTESVDPINGKYTDTSTSPADQIIKDENFTIVPVFDIINSSVNRMPNGTMPPSSSYLSSTNDFVKTTQSQDSSVYVPVTDNIPDYNLEQVVATQSIVSSAETKVMNSIVATTSTHSLPRIEIVTENVKYVSTEPTLSSTTVVEHVNPTKSNYVEEKTNDYILSSKAILTQINKEHKVEADSSSSSVSSFTPDTAGSPYGWVVPDNNKITMIIDSPFTMSSTQMPPKVAVDEDNIEITSEYPLSTSKETETKTASYNTEPSLPVSRVSVEQVTMTTEPTSATNTFSQTVMSLATIGKTNQDVRPTIKTTVLPQNILSAVNNNIPELTLALHSAEVTVAQITSEPSSTINTFAQTMSSIATIGPTNPDVPPGIKTTDLPQNVVSIVNNNIPQSTSVLQTARVTDAQVTSEPIPITKVVTLTTPLIATIGETNQDVQTGMKITDLPPNVLPAVNNKIPQSKPAPHVTGFTGAQITSKPTPTTNIFVQTTPLLATISETTNSNDFSQNVLSVVNNNLPQLTLALHTSGFTGAQVTSKPIPTANKFAETPSSLATNSETNPDVKTTTPPQNILAIISNKIPQSTPALDVAGATAAKFIAEPTATTYTVAQTTPLLAIIGKTNQHVIAGMKTTDLPQNVLSKVKNNIPQSTPTVYTVGVTDAQITSESTPITNTFAQITSSLATVGKTNHDGPTGIKTTNYPQYVKPTVNNYDPVVSHITTKIIDSLSVPDFMAETIKIDDIKVSGTSLGDTISSDVMSSNPTVPSNYSVKSVKNIIDHESIVIGNTSKNDSQNTTTTKSVDINKVEIVNHTETNWMRPDVNIDGIQIKESETEEAETSKPLVIKSVKDPQSKTLHSDSTKTAQINPIDVKTAHIIDSKIATVTPSPPYAGESIAPRNYTQTKTVIIKDNKNMGYDSSVNENVYQVRADSKNFSNGYKLSNTKTNITTSYNNLSQQNSTINDELEQHLLSGNHTITAEIQSHWNESGKQSNKTSDELSFNVTSTHNSNPTTLKLNAVSKNKSAITVSAPVFNCSNRTRGKYADNKDCRKFYTCIGNLQPMLGTCPNNTVFSEINKQCTKNLSHCVRNNQFHCLFEGRFSDFFKDNIYYICVKNRIHGFIRYKLQCQNDYHLNKESVKCEKNEELSTQSVSSVSETNTDESKPESKSDKMISTDNFECEKEGNFPYVKDCSKYYVCTKIKNVYRRKIKKCASDEVFDIKEKKCVESDSGEC